MGTRILWAFLALVLCAVVFTFVGTRFLWPDLVPRKLQAEDLPSYGQVGEFQLTDQLRRPIDRSHFMGRPWVADFVFIRCAGPCPLMTAQMARLADSLGADSPVRFASFSVDPDHDTPEELKRYSENYGADHSRWHFLTGDRQVIATLANKSFHLAVDDPRPRIVTGGEADSAGSGDSLAGASEIPDSLAAYDIPHSIRFVLVDQTGEIRGYYDGTDDTSLARLYQDLRALLAGT